MDSDTKVDMEHDKQVEDAILQRYVIDDGKLSNIDTDGAPGTSRDNGLRVRVWRIAKTDSAKLQVARREIEILSSVLDSALPVIADCLETDSVLWLVVYDRPSSSLREVIQSNGPLPDDKLKVVVTQLFTAIAVLFNAGYAHLRICPETVFLDGEHQLTIRGISYIHEYAQEKNGDLYAETSEKYGDDIYVAPEVFANHTYNARKATIWSCGVLLYYMVSGQTDHLSSLGHPSFESSPATNSEALPEPPPRRFSLSGRKLSLSAQSPKIVTYPGTERFSVPNYARDVISKMLTINPYRRSELIEVAAKIPKEFESKVSRPLIELAWLDYKTHVGPYAGLDTTLENDSSASSIFSGISKLSNPLEALLPGRRRSSLVGGVDQKQRRKSSAYK